MFLRATLRTHRNFKKHIDELVLIFWLFWTEKLLYLKKQNCFLKYMEFLMWVLRFEQPVMLKLLQCFELVCGYHFIMLCLLKWWDCLMYVVLKPCN